MRCRPPARRTSPERREGGVAQLSEWLQLMTAEIARKQEESRQARAEQARRGPEQSTTSSSKTGRTARKSD